MMITLTDGTRIDTYQDCARQRLLEFHALGTGIRKNRVNIYTSTGGATHKGVEQLLLGKDVDEAVNIALIAYDLEVNNKEFECDEGEDQPFIYLEQRSLIEALIRVYHKVQLPRILEEYDVVSVEEEIEYPLVECDIDNMSGFLHDHYNNLYAKESCNGITLMTKADAIFRSKATGSLVVYSLKTSSGWTDTDQKKYQYDRQGISELIAAEYKYKEEVEAVKMDILLKGSRKWLKEGSAKKKLQNTFLLHPYMYDTGLAMEFNLSYTKAKGWNRVNIWEQMKMKEWIDYLYNNALDRLIGTVEEPGVVITPYVYNRSLEDIENWIEQTQAQEIEVANNIKALQYDNQSIVGPREHTKQYRSLLNSTFPQRRKNCFQYGGNCQFIDICWKGVVTTSPEFEPRVPHHKPELIELSKGI